MSQFQLPAGGGPQAAHAVGVLGALCSGGRRRGRRGHGARSGGDRGRRQERLLLPTRPERHQRRTTDSDTVRVPIYVSMLAEPKSTK